jgi:hypothetical protein
MAVSRSDRNRSDKDAPTEKTFWDEIDKLKREVARLKPATKTQGQLFDQIPIGGIIAWDRAIAEIPGNYEIVAEALGRYLRSVATAVTEPGTTGGALTHKHGVGTYAVSSVSAGTPAGTNSSDSAGTPAGTNANESAHTHGVTSNVAVANHAAHTHTFTQSSNATSPNRLMADLTATGVAASGTTGNPNATLTHSVTNNAVTSGAGSAHTHTFTGTALAAHTHTFTGTALAAHTHTLSGQSEEVNHEPPFYDVVWIRRKF